MSRLMVVLSAILMTTGLVVGRQGDSSPPERDECKFQEFAKSFSLQDPQNNTCTFTIPHWRCNGLCRTESLPSSKVRYNEKMKAYEPEEMEVKCKCCQPDPSRITNVVLPVIKCDEGYNWTGESISINLIWGCECLSCEGLAGVKVK